MNRDTAIEIAARSLDSWDFDDDAKWVTNVTDRADALLAAMGEPDTIAEHGECCAAQARITESRVVRELAAHFDSIDWSGSSRIVRCGDWRAKGAK